jgi:hypothetical protein
VLVSAKGTGPAVTVLDGRLGRLLDDAASGRPPPPDGATEVIPPPAGRAEAVVAFTAHHVVATRLEEAAVRAALAPDDIAAAMQAPFLAWLGSRLGCAPGMVDLVLVAKGAPDSPPAPPLASTLDHARVERSRTYRDDVDVYGDANAFMTVGRGLAGRLEVTVEVTPSQRGGGVGRRLAASARSLVPVDEPLYAQVSPGNVASLRAFLAAGFTPVAAEVLFLHEREGSASSR